MSNCTSACPTQDHATYGECLRSKNLKVAYCGIGGGDATKQHKWDARLERYRAATRQGIQPAGTKPKQIEAAIRYADKVGTPYQRATSVADGTSGGAGMAATA